MLRIPRPIGTLFFLLAWLMPWRPAYCIRAEQSKLSFFVHRRDLIGRHIAKYGSHEPVLTRWISDYLATSSQGLFVDVGANLGWYAVHAAQHTAVETVIAFEPDSFNGWLLDRNLSLNGIDNVIVNTCAVGAQRRFVPLYRYKPSNCGRHSVLTNYGYGSRLVPMMELDTALENLGLADHPVLIVKIDLEGYEPEVVAGASQTLARADVVIIEYSPGLGRAGGLSPESMIDQLYAAGLLPYQLGANEWTKESPSSRRQFEGQMHLIWIRAGKDKYLWTGGSASSFLPTDKAALLRLAETWRCLAERGHNAARANGPSIQNNSGPSVGLACRSVAG